MLSKRATADTSAAYLNISPEAHTFSIIEALGFRPIGWGRYEKSPRVDVLWDAETECHVFAWEQAAA